MMILQSLNLKFMGFWVKIVLGLREARGRQKREISCVWNLSHQPFKTENTHFSWVTYSRSYSQKMHLKHKAFHRKPVAKVSIWILCFQVFPLTSFRGKSLVASFSQKCLWRSFWRTTQKCILNKNLKHESIKTLSKTYKILKNLFGFDRQGIEHTHHIWSCTITQMK